MAVEPLLQIDQTSQLLAQVASDAFDPFIALERLKAQDLTFSEIGIVVDTSFSVGQRGSSLNYKMFIKCYVRKLRVKMST